MSDEYELLPHEELEALRHEVDRLKKSPFPDSKENENLLDSMKALTTSINKLIKIFEGAQEDMIKEYAEASPTKLLKEISKENSKIAEGIVALANLIKNEGNKPALAPAAPAATPMPPVSEPVSTFSPQTEIKTDIPSNLGNDLPPMEPADKAKHRKGLFNSFSK